MTFSKALRNPDPEDPDGSQGLKSAYEGIFVSHTKDLMVLVQAMSLVGLRDLLVGQVQAVKMAGKWAVFQAGSKMSRFGENKLFYFFLLFLNEGH